MTPPGMGMNFGAMVQRAIRNIESATSYNKRGRPDKAAKGPSEKDILMLVKLLDSSIPVWRERAHADLVALTWRDFGYEKEKWLGWFEANKNRTRLDWASDTLRDAKYDASVVPIERLMPECLRALSDGNPIARAAAYFLLRAHTGRNIPFPVRASAETRAKHLAGWIKWWRDNGAELIKKSKCKTIPSEANSAEAK